LPLTRLKGVDGGYMV